MNEYYLHGIIFILIFVIENKNKNNLDMNKHLVIFDGTSAFIINKNEISDYPDVSILGEFNDIDEADEHCEHMNELINKGYSLII